MERRVVSLIEVHRRFRSAFCLRHHSPDSALNYATMLTFIPVQSEVQIKNKFCYL